MKRIYKNIKIPYHYYDPNTLLSGYIYKDVFYLKESEVFTKYLGIYLTYHYTVNNMLKEVHDYEDVLIDVINNYDTFKIENKYKNEYSKRELSSIEEAIKHLKNKDFRNIEYKETKYNKKKFLTKEEKKYRDLNEEIKQYKNVDFPKEVYSTTLKSNIFVYKGEYYFTALYCLEETCLISLYFQFNGDGIEDSYNHNHEHDFSSVIRDLINDNDNFILYDYQKEFYSNQEIEFLNQLHNKLLEDNFHPIQYKSDEAFYNRYCYLEDNNKKIRLFFHKIYGDILDIRDRNNRLRRYK